MEIVIDNIENFRKKYGGNFPIGINISTYKNKKFDEQIKGLKISLVKCLPLINFIEINEEGSDTDEMILKIKSLIKFRNDYEKSSHNFIPLFVKINNFEDSEIHLFEKLKIDGLVLDDSLLNGALDIIVKYNLNLKIIHIGNFTNKEDIQDSRRLNPEDKNIIILRQWKKRENSIPIKLEQFYKSLTSF